MNLTIDDIVTARLWAEEHRGEDELIDVYQYKLLEIAADSHGSSSGYHSRSQDRCEKIMADISERFKVEPKIESEF